MNTRDLPPAATTLRKGEILRLHDGRGQRIEVGEVRHARQRDDADSQRTIGITRIGCVRARPRTRRGPSIFKGHTIFLVQPDRGEV